MACGMVCQRLLPTACADSRQLTRNRSVVYGKFVVELCFWPDVVVTIFGVDHAQPLDLSDAELGFGKELDDGCGFDFGSKFHRFVCSEWLGKLHGFR